MNTRQIQSCMQQDRYMRGSCLGAFPADTLPSPPPPPASANGFGLVVNTDPSTGPGEHWLAVWVQDGNGEYFDSYAQQQQPPPHPVQLYLGRWAPGGWRCVLDQAVQGPLSTVCGQHCLWFLYQRSRGQPYQPPASDEAVNDFVERKFALDLEPYDMKMITVQICKALGL